MIVKVEPVEVVHANGLERSRIEYGIHIDMLDTRRFESEKQAEQAARTIEKAIRKVIGV